MMAFLFGAVVMSIVALLVLFRPFIFKSQRGGVTHQQVIADAYQEQLTRLKADQVDGSLSAESYGIAVRELEKRVLEEATCITPDRALISFPKKTIISVCVLLPLMAASLYVTLGDSNSLDGHERQNRTASKEVEQMVAGLVEKLKKNPNNPKGWVMLARSYKVMGRPMDAEKAYETAGDYIADDAQLLADYADVMASNANGNFAGKPKQLIQKALAVDPNNAMALWLSGTIAFNENRFTDAVKTWDHLQNLIDPESDDARVLKSSIEEAIAKGDLGSGISERPAERNPVSANTVGVSGSVSLGPDVAKRAEPGNVLMVIARRPGERMPIAVYRIQASSWPIQFKIDDAMNMNPQIRLSQQKTIEIEARLSKSGQAKPVSGDLYSPPVKAALGVSHLSLRLDKVRP